MTCKDCVHYEVCQNIMFEEAKLSVKAETVIVTIKNRIVCKFFKNKADFVEVKHGEWARQKGRPEAICSECGREVAYQIIDNKWRFENFCPHCGADMRKGGADNGEIH